MNMRDNNRKKSKTSKIIPGIPKPDKSWTILFVGQNGEVIPYKRFKGLIYLAVAVLAVAIAAALGLFWLHQNTLQEKKKLQTILDQTLDQIKSLRHEKDVLTARMVLAESRVKENMPHGPEISAEEKPEGRPEADFDNAQDNQTAGPAEIAYGDNTSKKIAEIEGQESTRAGESDPTSNNSQTAENLSVKIENFRVDHESTTQTYSVEFKIKNTSPNSQRVAGRAAVILKNEESQPNQWLTLPTVTLVNGVPSGRIRGKAFAINYFRTMRYKKDSSISPETITKATVFVFTDNGDLLLEKDFPVKLKSEADSSFGES